MNISTETIWDYLLSVIADYIVQLVLFSFILAGIVKVIQAVCIARKLLKKNRGKLGQGYGTQAADVFIQTWRADQIYATRHVEYLGSGNHFQPKGKIAEVHLVPLKLAEVFTDPHSGERKFRVIRNFRNWLVLKALVFDLVHKYDDDAKLYKGIPFRKK